MSTPSKRVRSTNFSREEQLILLEEIKKYKKIIENKTTNKVSCSEKADAWKCIETSFNSKVSAYRTLQQLQSKYENLKSEARKISANEKLGLRGTGGGPFKGIKDDPIMALVLELINIKTVVGFTSLFDSDAIVEENITDTVTFDCPADLLLDQHNDVPNTEIIHNENRSTSIFFLEQPSAKNTDNEIPLATEIVNSSNASGSKCMKRNLPFEEVQTLTDNDWSKYTTQKMKRPIRKKLRPTLVNPVIEAKEKYYEKKTLLIEKEIQFLEQKEAREKEEHQKKMLLLDLELEKKRKELEM